MTKVKGHTHTFKTDNQGNGLSSKDKGHSHVIKGGKCLTANNHVHGLKYDAKTK